jgi:hypothetical protein
MGRLLNYVENRIRLNFNNLFMKRLLMPEYPYINNARLHKMGV